MSLEGGPAGGVECQDWGSAVCGRGGCGQSRESVQGKLGVLTACRSAALPVGIDCLRCEWSGSWMGGNCQGRATRASVGFRGGLEGECTPGVGGSAAGSVRRCCWVLPAQSQEELRLVLHLLAKLDDRLKCRGRETFGWLLLMLTVVQVGVALVLCAWGGWHRWLLTVPGVIILYWWVCWGVHWCERAGVGNQGKEVGS